MKDMQRLLIIYSFRSDCSDCPQRGAGMIFSHELHDCYILGTEISGGLGKRVVLTKGMRKSRVRFHEPFEQKWEENNKRYRAT